MTEQGRKTQRTKTQGMKTLDMVYIGMFAVIMAICSWISIPTTVPFSLQTFGVFLTVGLMGGKRGTLSILVYILLGAMGVPVFVSFTGGLGIILGNTGGYIVGFLVSALLMWGMEKLLGKKTWVLACSMALGLAALYAFGTVWFMVVYARGAGQIGVMTALGWCVFPFVIPDVVKIVIALGIVKTLTPVLRLAGVGR